MKIRSRFGGDEGASSGVRFEVFGETPKWAYQVGSWEDLEVERELGAAGGTVEGTSVRDPLCRRLGEWMRRSEIMA